MLSLFFFCFLCLHPPRKSLTSPDLAVPELVALSRQAHLPKGHVVDKLEVVAPVGAKHLATP